MIYEQATIPASLMPEHRLELNIPQMLISLAVQKHINLEAGRGTGKSFIVSWRVKDIVNYMPRAKCAIVGRTFEQLLTRTLPSTIKGLGELGFVKNLHYFIGTAPPKKWKWEEAYEAPLAYDYCITFYNGTTFQLVSLDKTESGRGFNFDAVIGDEAALLDYEKLQNNILLSLRGNLEYFQRCALHQSTLFVSTTPVSSKGKWFIKREEIARQDPENYLYLIAPSRYNLKNLGNEYFRNLKRTLLPHIYAAEIDCIRSGTADKPFYPTFNVHTHTYLASNDSYLFKIVDHEDKLAERSCRFDVDVNTMQAIDIALDYNAAISWLVAGQSSAQTYNIINSLFILSPKTLDNLIQEFCEYYRFHIKKEVNYYYDHTAVGKDAARSSSYSDIVTDIFIKNGWVVNKIYCGQAPRHETKKIFFEKLFLEKDPTQLKCRINQDRNKELITSIEQAGAVDGRDGVKKDKSTEKKKDVPDQEATHGSDAFDTLVYFKIARGLNRGGYMVHAVA